LVDPEEVIGATVKASLMRSSLKAWKGGIVCQRAEKMVLGGRGLSATDGGTDHGHYLIVTGTPIWRRSPGGRRFLSKVWG